MNIDDVVDYFKTGYMLNKETGLSHMSIRNWRALGYIPMPSQIRIQEMTNGKLKADFDVNKKR